MKNAGGMIGILMTLIIAGAVFIPMTTKFASETSPSVSNNEVNKQVYKVKLLKFNATINQVLTMSRGEDICGNPNDLAKSFSRLMNAQMASNSSIKLIDGTVMEFKKPAASGCFDISVDFNGSQKPNKQGVDRYKFTINQSNSGNFLLR